MYIYTPKGNFACTFLTRRKWTYFSALNTKSRIKLFQRTVVTTRRNKNTLKGIKIFCRFQIPIFYLTRVTKLDITMLRAFLRIGFMPHTYQLEWQKVCITKVCLIIIKKGSGNPFFCLFTELKCYLQYAKFQSGLVKFLLLRSQNRT